MLNWFAFWIFPSFTFKLTQSKRMEFNSYAKSSKMSPANMGKWEPNRLTIGIFSLVLFTFFVIYACIFSISWQHSAWHAVQMEKNRDSKKNFNGKFWRFCFHLMTMRTDWSRQNPKQTRCAFNEWEWNWKWECFLMLRAW